MSVEGIQAATPPRPNVDRLEPGREQSPSSPGDEKTTAAGAQDLSTVEPSRPAQQIQYVKPAKGYGITVYLTLLTFMTSVTTGLITTSIPTMAIDLDIPAQTIYWPLSVFSLTAGACLIIAGSVADIVGSRRVFLTGVLLLAAFTLGCGLSQSFIQLILCRAMQGVAVAMCLPTSVGILCTTIASGRQRNLGFACTGLGQPLGFSVGLILGGIFINTIGWRAAWYFAAATIFACFPVGFLLLPKDALLAPPSLTRLRTQIDWPGAIIASASLSMLSYVLVQVSQDRNLIHDSIVIALLTTSLVLMPTFVWWMHVAAERNLPVLIPNKLWKGISFSSICIMVMMSYAVIQILELYTTLFFQKVQLLDPLQSSLRLLPSLVVGAALNLTVGLIFHRVSIMWLVFSTSLACSGAPLLMALIDPSWPYWYAAFPAQILLPLSVDVLFCVGVIVISQEFPENTKALAGAVFSTMAQFGVSVGLATVGIIADSVTQASGYEDKASISALFQGYKAAFWAAFGLTLLIALITVVGLRKVVPVDTAEEGSNDDRGGVAI
ncbi:integral membrane protein [Cercophora scortea]|uniref:Integral membrane protein n=1 Tax=Cercophora scortea TaxID=314031 RepID=A0AAE0IDP4_9PEZI|nr:integral membrane protein [Cercophora scortea]